MNGIINNGGLNADRKRMKMRHKLEIIILLFMIAVVSVGCIIPQELPVPNETNITPELTAEQKLSTYNETKPLKINDTFATWSMGYHSNESYYLPYFRVITNYSAWTAFLDEQSYRKMTWKLEGELYPGLKVLPSTIEPADFNDYFIVAAMMGYIGIKEPKIEITNISRLNNTVNVTVRMYKPRVGAAVITQPYHIVIVKREVLPAGNSTFIFMDTGGKLLEKVEVNE